MRAYLNGKMDLSQAESVADIIASESAAAHALAINQMRGGVSDQIRVLRSQLVDLASLLELELDFSEEDVEFADRTKLKSLVVEIRQVVQQLTDSFRLGNAIKNGIVTVIAGRPNAGKSTLLKLLIAEEKPTEGKIFLGDQEITALSRNELPFLRRRIGTVFQDFKLLSNLTAYENVAFAMEVAGRSRSEIEEDVPQVMQLVGLEQKGGQFPRELSGGEQQRVAIARALVHQPDLIIADEPTGNLDPLNTWDVIRLLTKIHELGTTIILATHDREIINTVNKRVVSLDKGRVIRDEEKGKYIL